MFRDRDKGDYLNMTSSESDKKSKEKEQKVVKKEKRKKIKERASEHHVKEQEKKEEQKQSRNKMNVSAMIPKLVFERNTMQEIPGDDQIEGRKSRNIFMKSKRSMHAITERVD